MRVSDLLEREPFGEILESTLSAYWTEVYGSPIEVYWGKGLQGNQEWLGNAYLNFFCTRNVDSICFENIVREYGYARVWWRRGLQSLFVRTAVTTGLRAYFSRLRFRVSQPIPDDSQQLIMGGRNRLRIIYPHSGRCVVIAKKGLSCLGFEREVEIRQGYASQIAPKFLGVQANCTAFAEEFFVGTPSNRLPLPVARGARQEAISRLTESVHRPSLRTVSLVDYLQQLADFIKALSSTAGEHAYAILEDIVRVSGGATLGVSMTHGDFQNANILYSPADLRIIDWETAGERSQLYDIATLTADIRLAPDRFYAWQRVVENWLDNSANIPELLIPIDGRGSLIGHVAVWWLEESLHQLEESRESYFGPQATLEHAVASDIARAGQYLASISG